MRSSTWLVAVICILVTVSACRSTDQPDGVELLAGSAISLQPALDSAIAWYAAHHEGVRITLSYAGSGTIRRQIEFGAPLDVYLSAAPEHLDSLSRKHLIVEHSRVPLASNTLVLVASARRPPLGDVRDLLLPGVVRIAIGQPDIVPAGRYAHQALERMGLLPDLVGKLVYTKDVQQVLVYVRTASVDAGFVYASDVRATTPVRVIAAVPDSLHAPILYEGAVTSRSRHVGEASRFLAYLASDTVQALFADLGFRPLAR